MAYEKAWLNENIKSNTDCVIDSILIITSECSEADMTILNNAVAELGYVSKAATTISYDKTFAVSEPGSYELGFENGVLTIKGSTACGVLYGAFRAEFLIRMGRMTDKFKEVKVPSGQLRMLDHWDNMDGTIERGYSGNSFFFKDNKIIIDDRTRMYARLIASVGINAVVINNVNVRGSAGYLITKEYREPLKQLNRLFNEFGIKMYLSINFAAPMEPGFLKTADPLDEDVRNWWKETAKDIYKDIPSLGGFLVKADSEGRPGPFSYDRNHAEGANMLADAVAPFGGVVIWRCFVYNCTQDWRDKVTDRARAGYDNFKLLDGMFRDNVILQVKNGPMDFQIREPVSTLIGGMTKTNELIEFQIAQEYTGQQKHVCYLIPQFKEILDFKTYCKPENDLVKDIITGRTFDNRLSGMVAVTNTGDDDNWTGHDLAASNLYGFGRLAFDTELSSEEIADEWTRLTYGDNEKVVSTIKDILLSSCAIYEKYNAPLGIGWMVNPNFHYGPNVDGYEYSRWGTYHRADHIGIGVDRTSRGTGYTTQYYEPNASMYDSLETCPDELVLFFHHVPYTYVLKSGKTVIQHIYDSHFEGAEEAAGLREKYRSLKGLIDETAFNRTMERFDEQVKSANEWRDQINTYFYRKSGIEDEKHRTIY